MTRHELPPAPAGPARIPPAHVPPARVPPAHVSPADSNTSRRTSGRTSGRAMAVGIVAMAALAVVFGVYPLLDRTDSPVVQAVDEVLDQGSGSTGVAGGEVPDGHATLDDDIPAITGLDPDLAAAVQRAGDAAADDGIDFWITSGWRSAAYQQALLDQAVRRHGSLEAARRTVSTPEQSRHVTGTAIDIGPTEGAYWTIEHGAEYGLCQVYANEIWHFELLTEPGGTCPELLEDSSAG